MADAIDDDTLAAVVALWQSPLWPASRALNVFIAQPRTGRLKSTQPGQDVQTAGPYAVLDCRLARRELAGADKDGAAPWNDYRTVTITVYGVRADAVKGVGLVLALFGRLVGTPRQPDFSYPSGARFIRWWPQGDARIEEDQDAKAGKDVWKGTIEAEVWSIRQQ